MSKKRSSHFNFKRPVKRSFVFLLVLSLFLPGSTPGARAEGTILYVKPGGTGECSSWETACSLQTALTTYAVSGDQIWVAAGTYTPGPAGSDRTVTFQLKDGVSIYGGFAGSETLLSQRNWSTNVVILSGDLNGDDDGFTNNSENSYHVVTGANGAKLDGVTISGGNANGRNGIGSDPEDQGGGMFNFNSSPTLTNITFSGNMAYYFGGGMYNDRSSPMLSNVTFNGNPANSGGGMYNTNSSPTLTNVTFSGNTATYGGGMYNVYSSNPTLTNVTFSGNTSGNNGGGMVNGYSSPTLTNVTFSGNTTDYGGGGMINGNSNPTLINVTFSGNKATYFGGGMYNYNSSNPTLTNVTFSGNTTYVSGGGMYNKEFSNPTVNNSILWGNSSGEIYNEDGSTVNISYSDVQGGYTGTGNIDADPLFVAAVPAALSTGGDLHLRTGSPAIDAGDNTVVTATTDRGGRRRITGSTVDMGAYEWGQLIYVKANANGANNGTSWIDAYLSLQDALSATYNGDQIWVAAGTYKSGLADSDRTITFQLKDGVAVYGGFAGCETLLSQRNWTTNVVILSGDLNGDDTGFTNNGENSYHVVKGTTGATLDGVTIRGGNANGGSTATIYGGGMYNYGSSPTLANVTFSGNTAIWGGGMYNQGSNTMLTNVTFSANTASSSGGGIYINNGSPILTNVTFSGNTAWYGGGILINYGNPTLNNVTFSSNAATHNGGGIGIENGSATITNVTFFGNSADRGGGMYNYSNSSPTVRNSILWGDSGDEIFNETGSTPIIRFSDVQGGYPGAGNIDADPLLGPLGNYGGGVQTMAFLPGSPVIDATSTYCPVSDARGLARSSSSCDLGAFESQGFFLNKTGGDGQSTFVNTAFAQPICVAMTANYAGEPLNGAKITFTSPASSASATLTSSPVTIADGVACAGAIANGIGGSYNVTASTAGAASVTFSLTNIPRIYLPVLLNLFR